VNVGFVLEGSVRISKQGLRVIVQLVSTRDGYQLWSRRYDRHIDDVFAVQDEIANEIVNMLRAGTGTRPPAVLSKATGNFEAYSWYLRGRYHLNRQTGDALHRAIDCFEEALARSLGYTPALVGAAVAWLNLGMFAMEAPLEAMPKAREAAARALELNDREGEALSVAACTINPGPMPNLTVSPTILQRICWPRAWNRATGLRCTLPTVRISPSVILAA
jgi:serine/threonine-protein kinase